jgi:hypothetical protein
MYNSKAGSVYCRIALLIHFERVTSNDARPFSPTVNDCMRCILDIEGSLPDSLRRHPWIYSQIVDYTKSFHIDQLWPVEKRTEELLMLARRLSPGQHPKLKDETILRCLHNLYCPDGRGVRFNSVSRKLFAFYYYSHIN